MAAVAQRNETTSTQLSRRQHMVQLRVGKFSIYLAHTNNHALYFSLSLFLFLHLFFVLFDYSYLVDVATSLFIFILLSLFEGLMMAMKIKYT